MIPALPMTANTTFAAQIKERVPEIYPTGDCKEPRLMPDSVADGWTVGNMV